MDAIQDYLLGLADDELILGHRDSEWCGRAPILEEDIAFANIALDEIGHADLWYGLLAELSGEDPDTYPDRLVYFREPMDYRNIQMVELPIGDWAFTILRQYLFDACEQVRLEALAHSQYTPLANIASKIVKEEFYHCRHTSVWVRRLGLGSAESHLRMQNALDDIWPYTAQMTQPMAGEDSLVQAGIVPDSSQLQSIWQAKVIPFLQECSLALPDLPGMALQREEHTPYLRVLIEEMQSVARSEANAVW